jgi:hypothetical protein
VRFSKKSEAELRGRGFLPEWPVTTMNPCEPVAVKMSTKPAGIPAARREKGTVVRSVDLFLSQSRPFQAAEGPFNSRQVPRNMQPPMEITLATIDLSFHRAASGVVQSILARQDIAVRELIAPHEAAFELLRAGAADML